MTHDDSGWVTTASTAQQLRPGSAEPRAPARRPGLGDYRRLRILPRAGFKLRVRDRCLRFSGIPDQARIYITTKTKNTSPWYNLNSSTTCVKTSTDLYFMLHTDDILILVWQAFQLVMPPKYTEHYLCKQVSTCTYIYFQECR